MKIQPPIAKLDDPGILALKTDDDDQIGWIVVGFVIAAIIIYILVNDAKKD